MKVPPTLLFFGGAFVWMYVRFCRHEEKGHGGEQEKGIEGGRLIKAIMTGSAE
jgi:hypothetical protein